jgi:hypothetical protein
LIGSHSRFAGQHEVRVILDAHGSGV